MPHWAPDLTSTVKVPLTQALISAIPTGLLTVAGLVLALFLIPQEGGAGVRVLAAFLIGGVVYIIQTTRYWHVYRAEAMEALQQRIEYAETRDGKDYNLDGYIGGRMVKANTLAPDVVRERLFTQDVREFVTTALSKGTGERELVGLKLAGGRALEQARYDELRDLFLSQRYAYWKSEANHRNGWYFRPDLSADEIIGGVLGY